MAAIYEVVLRTLFAGQECVNRWNYVTTSTPTTADGSIALLAGTGLIPVPGDTVYEEPELLPRLQAILSTGLLFGTVSARNVYEVNDFYEYVYEADLRGSVTGESSTPFTAIGYRTNRVRQDIARGTKRFAGVPESSIGTEGILAPAVAAAVKAVGDAMSESVTFTVGSVAYTFAPAVVKKEEYTTPKGNKAYRYYATLAAQLAQVASPVEWASYAAARSQTSRQYGRGQ